MSEPVVDWTTDYDVFDHDYVNDPYPIWDDLRAGCPVAHTDRWGGSWLPTTYKDVAAIAHDIAHFSSRSIAVVPPPLDEEMDVEPMTLAPIAVDPPVHTWTRRLLLPWFSHRRVEELYEPFTRELCRSLLDGIVDAGAGDAAAGYAQQIPVRVIAQVLGVPEDQSDVFTGWVRDILEFAHDDRRRRAGREAIGGYLVREMNERRAAGAPGNDLISELLRTDLDGGSVPDHVILGMAALTLIAGIDTTWSAIGSSLWHLATHPDDRRRLVDEPALLPVAVEELLRAYSPVTMARLVTEDLSFEGCPMRRGDRVLLNFPAANRDPAAFERADEVVIDREVNRHLAFGVGIHRCAGSNLARMELRVALEEWLARIPSFELAPGGEVTWAGGQVRGPRTIPVVIR